MGDALCGRLETPHGFSMLCMQPASSFLEDAKHVPGAGSAVLQEDGIHACMCGGRVGNEGMGKEQRTENPISAMQNLSYFLLPPCPPPFPRNLVSPHLCRISGTWGSQEIASFLC